MRYIFPLLFLFACNNSSEVVETSSPIQQTKLENVRFENNRIFLDLISEKGDKVSFFTDTGGGKIVLPSAVEKLGLETKNMDTEEGKFELVDLRPIFEKQNLPAPVSEQFVYREEGNMLKGSDGMLGAIWFGDKAWNFDYQNKALYVVDKINWKALDQAHVVELGFMSNMFGSHPTHFPRIPIEVEGQTIQTLFDSGATAMLSEEAQKQFNGATEIGAGFIVARIFDDWRIKHPEWEVIEKGDAMIQEDMIKAPKLSIGGYEVGPVWFARRADKNFDTFMSQWMDEPIEGAIGGSAFQYFKQILIDYEEERVYFEL